VETVLLTDPTGRKTACVSSQAGCGMGCAFCKTAKMGLSRNLEPHEIVEQLFHLEEGYGEVSNIVFMGMGEPLLNIDNVSRAIAVLHHPEGKNIGLRRITISTCGIIKGIRELASSGPYTRLACSMPSAITEKRLALMPVTRANPIPALKDALVEYGNRSKQRITIETVLLRNVNDDRDDAIELARFAHGIDADVNLIPWNPASGIRFERPETERIRRFAAILTDHGVHVVQRFTKGNNINAACGQLACE
jgi:23S rRNA (adenine2503-C2)-methyltransferase